MGILNFESRMCTEVQKYILQMAFFFFSFFLIRFRLMAVRVIFDIGRVGDKRPVYPMKGR